MSLDDSIEQVRSTLIKKMGTKAFLRPSGLIDALATESNLSTLTVRQALGRLMKQGWLEGVATDGMPFKQVRIIGEVPAPAPDPHLQRWVDVLTNYGLGDGDKCTLATLSNKLTDYNADEMGRILHGLVLMRDFLASETGRHRFLVSASYLLGSSKLLDTLSVGPALRNFGIDVNLFPTHPLYVVVAGPRNPTTVVLVENPAAFEMAVATEAIKHCAFVATFGFGLSKSQEDYGNQLVSMVDDRFNKSITLTREGSTCPPAKDLLRHSNITFWGDLDPAGIEIYLRLKRSIPNLQLSALYQPMIEALHDPGNCHPYSKAVGKEGQIERIVECSEVEVVARDLLARCLERGVDQEQVLISAVENLAQYPLEMGHLHA
ncbi:MAG: DUF2220 family protein [Gallionellaceae bacterium]|nr:DUF2220 family protein [Gallionellaceae bacterium]